MRRLTALALAVSGALPTSALTAAPPVAAAPPAVVAPAAQHPAAPVRVGRVAADPIAHDPTTIRDGRYYYTIITGDSGRPHTYLPVKRSADLLHWTELGPVFSTPPAWVVQQLGLTPADFWAPDLTYRNGEFRLYYAASSFGTNNSVIGLATNRTLDPANPDYHWVDRGMVLRSHSTDDVNAIDPDVSTDARGGQWLAFGSFWDGIRLRRLDPASGLPSTVDTTLYALASRGGASIEGPSIVRHGGFYYLFVSLDFCCRGSQADYRTVVGRATGITGPYADAAGVPMLAGGGTELLRGYDEFRGTGGGDVMHDARRGDLFVHHYYDLADAGAPKLSVRPVTWSRGWPVLGDPLSGGTMLGRGPAYVRIVGRDSGAALDDAGCGYEGADIRLAAPLADPPAPASPATGPAAPAACQQWRVDDRADGYASLGNRFSNKIAEVAACVNTDGARVAQWGWLNNDCQQYRIVGTDAGWARIENKLAGRVLTVAGCGGVGAAVQASTWTGSACQQFRLDPVGDVLITDAAGRRALDGCRAAPRFAPATGTGCDTWRFQPTAEGFYRLRDTRTGRAVGTRWRVDWHNDGTVSLVDPTGATLTGGPVRLLTPSPVAP